MRRYFFIVATVLVAAFVGLGLVRPVFFHAFWVLGPLLLIGIADALQTTHAIRRNFPLIGWGRYALEEVRPEIQQYFIEMNTQGRPFSREQRSVVYQRAKLQLDTLPFGTQQDVYAEGYEWLEHSLAPLESSHGEPPRVLIGEGRCALPYSSSLLNVSAMSFGALSSRAVMALNRGAAMGGFAHNTGEGGVSEHHKQGGDLIWQLGTGCFGACKQAGVFDAERFAAQASYESIRMIELKLSQGAKPGHGGILPAAKLTPEIAAIRGVPLGHDVLSPPGHAMAKTPLELVAFVEQLRELSGGKPVGIKLCVGRRYEFVALCKAMVETGHGPDYVAVDGAEGGTGAAPLEFSNRVGTPLMDGLTFVHNALTGFGLRQRIRVAAAGKILTGFDMARALALGADFCASARAMMLALGCIQALRCNSNKCPAGVATQDPRLVAGLVVDDKATRVCNYQRQTVASLLELLAASGLRHPTELRPEHIVRRISHTLTQDYGTFYNWLEPGQLLGTEPIPEEWQLLMARADANTFAIAT